MYFEIQNFADIKKGKVFNARKSNFTPMYEKLKLFQNSNNISFEIADQPRMQDKFLRQWTG